MVRKTAQISRHPPAPRAPCAADLGSSDGRRDRGTIAAVAASGRLPMRRRALRDLCPPTLRRLLPLHPLSASHRDGLIGQRPRRAVWLSTTGGARGVTL